LVKWPSGAYQRIEKSRKKDLLGLWGKILQKGKRGKYKMVFMFIGGTVRGGLMGGRRKIWENLRGQTKRGDGETLRVTRRSGGLSQKEGKYGVGKK